MAILVLNAGSSSIKVAVFDSALSRLLSGTVTGIGDAARLDLAGQEVPCSAPDHAAALSAILTGLQAGGLAPERLTAAAHRVVHGGPDLVRPCRITLRIEAAIRAAVPLAPLHNPHSLAAIEALQDLAPELMQFASFDTAFHATNPDVATTYAIPRTETAAGLRRYGFHGISYASLVARLPDLSGAPLPRRLLAFHLGNGASICAILEGRSVATTMGYSPLDGLTMGTRSGGIDANAVLRLVRTHGVDRTSDILNAESGLLALGGHADLRALRRAGTSEADFALEHFAYWAARHAGSLAAAMGGVDAYAFTGGIGENDAAMRQAILDRLEWMGAGIPVWVVPAEEERAIAADARALLGDQR